MVANENEMNRLRRRAGGALLKHPCEPCQLRRTEPPHWEPWPRPRLTCRLLGGPRILAELLYLQAVRKVAHEVE